MLDSIKFEKERLEKQGGISELQAKLGRLYKDEADIQKDLDKATQEEESRKQIKKVHGLHNELADVQDVIDKLTTEIMQRQKNLSFQPALVKQEVDAKVWDKNQVKLNTAFSTFVNELERVQSEAMEMYKQAESEADEQLQPIIGEYVGNELFKYSTESDNGLYTGYLASLVPNHTQGYIDELEKRRYIKR